MHHLVSSSCPQKSVSKADGIELSIIIGLSAPGCSGAWVVRNGLLCGVIVASYEHEPVALMIQALDLANGVKEAFAQVSDLTLPEYDNGGDTGLIFLLRSIPEPQNAKQTLEMPQISSTHMLHRLEYNTQPKVVPTFSIHAIIDSCRTYNTYDWYCFNPESFTCICSYDMDPRLDDDMELQLIDPDSGRPIRVHRLEIHISARACDSSNHTVELIQSKKVGSSHEPWRLSLNTRPPPVSIPTQQKFERLQFKLYQANSWDSERPSAMQEEDPGQFCRLVFELLADIGDRDGRKHLVPVARAESARLMVHQASDTVSSLNPPTKRQGESIGDVRRAKFNASRDGSSSTVASAPFQDF